MAESTLTRDYDDVEVAVARFLNLPAIGDAARTAAQTTRIDEHVQSGYMRFLYPEDGYQWSFMSPTDSFSTVADDFDYDLPDNFLSMVGDMTVSDDGSWWPISERAEETIRDFRSQGQTTGRPVYYAVRAVTFVETTGQRYEMLLWPTPDQVYTIERKFNVLPDKAVTSTAPHFLGGMPHSRTIREACLAEAEAAEHDTQGLHEARFRQLLRASISVDTRLKPITLGFDAAQEPPSKWNRTIRNTVNGSVPP